MLMCTHVCKILADKAKQASRNTATDANNLPTAPAFPARNRLASYTGMTRLCGFCAYSPFAFTGELFAACADGSDGVSVDAQSRAWHRTRDLGPEMNPLVHLDIRLNLKVTDDTLAQIGKGVAGIREMLHGVDPTPGLGAASAVVWAYVDMDAIPHAAPSPQPLFSEQIVPRYHCLNAARVGVLL